MDKMQQPLKLFSCAPRFMRTGKESKELKKAQQDTYLESTQANSLRTCLQSPLFILNSSANERHCQVGFPVQVRMEEGSETGRGTTAGGSKFSSKFGSRISLKRDDNNDNQGGIKPDITAESGADEGFPGELTVDILNASILVVALGGTIKLRFKFDELETILTIPDETSIHVTFDKKRNIGCFPWNVVRAKWGFTFTLEDKIQLNHCIALIQGVAGAHRRLTPDRKPLDAVGTTKYVGQRPLRIWIGTWNMGNKAPPDEVPHGNNLVNPIEMWSLLSDDSIEAHDIYAFGVQEASDSIWKHVENIMRKHSYTKVANCSLGNIGQVVYVRSDRVNCVNEVQNQYEAFGFLGGVGTNKGSAAITMTYRNQPILFIVSHLAAKSRMTRLRVRNKQARITVNNLKLGRLTGSDVLKQFSAFWFGDMNYRIKSTPDWEGTLSRTEIIDIVNKASEEENRKLMQEHDQLTIECEKNMVFSGFEEGSINFAPSYKYVTFPKGISWNALSDRNTSTVKGYCTEDVDGTSFSKKQAVADLGEKGSGVVGSGYYVSSGEKNGLRREFANKKEQCPSWCDRILHKPLPNVYLNKRIYKSFDNILTADHNPVCASYLLGIPTSEKAMHTSQFRVGAIQFLEVEVITMRHPAVSLKVLYPDDDIVKAGHRPTSLRTTIPPLEEAGKEAQLAYKRGIAVKLIEKGNVKGMKSRRFTQKEKYASDRLVHKGTKGSNKSGKKTFISLSAENDFFDDFGLETPDQLETYLDEVDAMPHIEKLAVAVQARFLSYASTRCTVSSSVVQSLAKEHTFMPMSRPFDYGKIGDECEFRWKQHDLEDMTIGPFFTTCEFLATQFFVLHIAPRKPTRDRFSDSVGSCTISLTQGAFGGDVCFNEELHYNGEIIGLVRGRYRILWDDTGWADYDADSLNHHFDKRNIGSIPVNKPNGESANIIENIKFEQKVEPKLYRHPTPMKRKITQRGAKVSKDESADGFVSPREFMKKAPQRRTRTKAGRRTKRVTSPTRSKGSTASRLSNREKERERQARTIIEDDEESDGYSQTSSEE